jgi:hypothetical protein
MILGMPATVTSMRMLRQGLTVESDALHKHYALLSMIASD